MGRKEATGRVGRRICTVAAILLLSAVATGCGGSNATPAVQLALTAPSEGARVTASLIRVFGTVSPRSAKVIVAGRRVHVAGGEFARWVALPRGVSHVSVKATATGYATAVLRITVHSTPAPERKSQPAAPAVEAGLPGRRARAPALPSPARRYSARLQATFMRTCEAAASASAAAAASASACRCALERLEAQVSERELEETERAILNGEARVPRWLREAAVTCRRA
jgi:hypothetical protein